jgi:tRNA threonylcarbamoyladenosine dehydratase
LTVLADVLATPGLADDADLERRFGGLRRLYGEQGYARLRGAHVAVVGLGGVGSWAVEALARCGVAGLVLIDMDHVAESNVNRQVQATGRTLGMSKAQALRERIRDIHPGCAVHCVEEFASADNWPALLPQGVHAVIDACDQARAKWVLAAWARTQTLAFVCVGAAGGKRAAHQVDVADLAEVTHDPLLAGLRQRLRKESGAPRTGRMHLRCVFSREAVAPPAQECDVGEGDGSLNCAGYGSSVTVTATFGMVAAAQAIEQLLAMPHAQAGAAMPL